MCSVFFFVGRLRKFRQFRRRELGTRTCLACLPPGPGPGPGLFWSPSPNPPYPCPPSERRRERERSHHTTTPTVPARSRPTPTHTKPSSWRHYLPSHLSGFHPHPQKGGQLQLISTLSWDHLHLFLPTTLTTTTLKRPVTSHSRLSLQSPASPSPRSIIHTHLVFSTPPLLDVNILKIRHTRRYYFFFPLADCSHNRFIGEFCFARSQTNALTNNSTTV